MIWFTSDWHLFHDREFIYKPRGFSSISEMNEIILEKYNECVSPSDTVYVLGDVLLGGSSSLEDGCKLISQFKGHKILIRGNHDTDRRVKTFLENGLFEECYDALRIKHNGYNFFLCHYPTITSNMETHLKECVINLHGHTHDINEFYRNIHTMYNVGIDANSCYPVNIEEVLAKVKLQFKINATYT